MSTTQSTVASVTHLPQDLREGNVAHWRISAVEALVSPPHVAAHVEIQVSTCLRREAHLQCSAFSKSTQKP